MYRNLRRTVSARELFPGNFNAKVASRLIVRARSVHARPVHSKNNGLAGGGFLALATEVCLQERVRADRCVSGLWWIIADCALVLSTLCDGVSLNPLADRSGMRKIRHARFRLPVSRGNHVTSGDHPKDLPTVGLTELWEKIFLSSKMVITATILL